MNETLTLLRTIFASNTIVYSARLNQLMHAHLKGDAGALDGVELYGRLLEVLGEVAMYEEAQTSETTP